MAAAIHGRSQTKSRRMIERFQIGIIGDADSSPTSKQTTNTPTTHIRKKEKTNLISNRIIRIQIVKKQRTHLEAAEGELVGEEDDGAD
jgi:hypothetical protein